MTRRSWHRDSDFSESGALCLWRGRECLGRVWFALHKDRLGAGWYARVGEAVKSFDYLVDAKAWAANLARLEELRQEIA